MRQNTLFLLLCYSPRGVNTMWFGFNDIKREGHWVWTNPSARCKRYTNWHRGEPNNFFNEDCAQMYKSGKWNDLKCHNKLASVCEYGPKSLKICASVSNKFVFQGIRYEIIPKKMTWHAAELTCKRSGGHLATIKSAKVNHQLNYQMKLR